MAPEPFQVEFHVAGGAIIRFTLTEETLRQHPRPAVRAMAANEGRAGLEAAAAFWLESAFAAKKAGGTTSIVDDDGAWWVIAPSALLAIRLFDPTAATPPKHVGFVTATKETTPA